MKHITICLLLMTISIGGYSQRKIKKVIIAEKGFNVSLNYHPIKNTIVQDGVSYTFNPISPDQLNSTFRIESSYNGKFEYSHFEDSRSSYFLKRKRIRIREKSDFEFLREGVDWLLENDKITKDEFDELHKQILYYFDFEEAEEIYSFNKYVIANPYYISGKYLNVFKVDISNPTGSYKVFQDDIVLETGNHLLRPLTGNEISQLLNQENKNNTFKSQTLNRNHFEQSFLIPPYSNFKKYLSVLPIDFKNESIELSMSGNDSKAKWVIEKEEEIVEEMYTFFEFAVDYNYDTYVSESGLSFNVINDSESNVDIDDDLLFVNEDFLDQEFEIFTLSLYSDKLYFGRTIGKGSRLVNMEKNRRSKLDIELEKISDLKKKAKFVIGGS